MNTETGQPRTSRFSESLELAKTHRPNTDVSELAEVVGVEYNTFYKWSNGTVESPPVTLDMYVDLATFLGCPLAIFMSPDRAARLSLEQVWGGNDLGEKLKKYLEGGTKEREELRHEILSGIDTMELAIHNEFIKMRKAITELEVSVPGEETRE